MKRKHLSWGEDDGEGLLGFLAGWKTKPVGQAT